MITRLVAAALLGFAALPGIAGAWADEGHKIVCGIAWERLSDESRALVRELLAADRKRWRSFAHSCVWADQVKEKTHLDTAEYHYIDLPRDAGDEVDLERDCPAYDCAPIAIRRYAAQILNPETVEPAASGEIQRLEALKFLAHFVADIHQPLHVGYVEDRGGNDILVDWFGKPGTTRDDVTLHVVWDYWILRRARLSYRASTRRLAAEVTAAEAAEWRSFDLEGWAGESHRLAVDYAYDLPADKLLRSAYFERALPVVKLQLKKAGVRLAYLINSIADGSVDLSRDER